MKPITTNQKFTIIVMGYIVRGPMGGMAWHYLQYCLGLAKLGHEVYFLEDSDDYPSCYHPLTLMTDADPSEGLIFAQSVFGRTDMSNRWSYYDAHTETWHGPVADRIVNLCANADILINVSGVNPLRRWLREVPCRVFIDTDPVFKQIQHLTNARAHALASQHTSFFSFGENFGRDGCSIPNDGFPWLSTRQPIVLDAWPVTQGNSQRSFTTVMQWNSYEPLAYDNCLFGMKSESFDAYLDLPLKISSQLELALAADAATTTLLTGNGWIVRDSHAASLDPWMYQNFIQESKAEFSVAKHGYVVSRSGWFSERSAAYLASGRPIVVQDTGFSDWLPTGAGTLPFSTAEDAIAGIAEVEGNYAFHCRAARELAEEYFGSGKVLTSLLERALRSQPRCHNV